MTIRLFLLSLLLLVPLVPAASEPARVYGIHVDLPIAMAPYLSLDEEILLVKHTGATSVRQRMRWDEIEAAQGQFNWSQMDGVVDGLLYEGIEPVITLSSTPTWAADPECTAVNTATCPPLLDAWGNFVSLAVQRYQGKVEYWEVWNEPNNTAMWGGTVEDYYYLLQRGSAEIRAADPSARILIGGMTHMAVLGSGPWLRSLLGAPDIGDYFDIFAFHLYGTVGQPEETFASLYSLLSTYALSGKEIWVNETNPQMGSEQEQAQALATWFERIFYQGATRVYYFALPNWCSDADELDREWCDANVYSLDKPNGGLVHATDFTPTLVYEAYRSMTGDPPAAPTNLSAAMDGADIVLSWQDNSDNEIRFSIERCEGEACTAFAEVGTSDVNGTSWTDTISPGQKYSYRMRAVGLLGRFSDYTNTVSVAAPAPQELPPPAPTNLKSHAIIWRRMKLTWTNNGSDQDSVQIERCRGLRCTDFTLIASVAGEETSFTDTGLTRKVFYRYRVRAINVTGYSEYSSIAGSRIP